MTTSIPQGTKQLILQTAYRLILENGYNDTSMSDIASQCGISKSLVQKHVGTKDSLIKRFLEDLLDYTDEFLTAHQLKTDSYWGNLFLIGQVHYSFLMASESRKKLFLDILSDRALSEVMIGLDVEWAFSYMHTFSEEQKDELSDNMALVMGGAYELLYRSLISGKEVDAAKLQYKMMSLTMFLQGFSREEVEQLLPDELSERDLQAALAYLEAKFLPEN